MRRLFRVALILVLMHYARTAHAGPLEPLRPSEIINLFAADLPTGKPCTSCGANCRELDKLVKGAETPIIFTGIASGQVLVVTGVEWTGGGDEVGFVLQYGSSLGQYAELARYPSLSGA